MRQRRDYANLIDFNEDDQEYFGSEPSEDDPVKDIKARLARLSVKVQGLERCDVHGLLCGFL